MVLSWILLDMTQDFMESKSWRKTTGKAGFVVWFFCTFPVLKTGIFVPKDLKLLFIVGARLVVLGNQRFAE